MDQLIRMRYTDHITHGSYDPYETKTPQTLEATINEDNEEHKTYLDGGSNKD